METGPALIAGCRWVESPTRPDGSGMETWNVRAALGFDAPRLFWLTNVAEGQWRGRHAHRDSILATFAVNGQCRILLDDGRQKQVVTIRERGPGLLIGPWIWHDLYEFSAGAAILVVASTTYAESDYIRDYEAFLRGAAARVP